MSLEQYWTILVKQWKLIITCLVVVGIGAYIGSRLLTPLYQSSTLVQVSIRSNNQADYNNLLASDQLVQTEAKLAVSDPVLTEVASHFPDMTADKVLKEATVTTTLNTQLFEIDVLDPSPTRAAALANDIATTLIRQQLQVIQQENSLSQQQIEQDLTTTQQQITATTTKIAGLQSKRENQAQVAVLQGQLGGLQQHYNQWQTALAQLELAEAQRGDFLRIAQPARPGLSPVQPNVLLITSLGLVIGLLLGILLAALFEHLDTRVRTPEALSELLGWSTLATVHLTKTSNKEEVINPSGRDINAEAYRILRTNIGFASIDKPLHSLVVTSALPRDGKSTIAANLAIFMARTGKQTLLIDADMHRPTQHALFGVSADKMGLSNAILAFSMPSVPKTPTFHQSLAPSSQGLDALTTTDYVLAPFVHSVGFPNLRVMPTGPLPPNPSELFDSKAMKRFLTVIANCGVEVVIFDTPPLLGLSDTSLLASKVDGTLVVIDMSRTTKGKLKLLKAALAQTGTKVLGCVANKQRRSRNDSVYSYYYYSQPEEQKGSEKQARNGRTSAVPDTPLSPVRLSPFEQGEKSN